MLFAVVVVLSVRLFLCDILTLSSDGGMLLQGDRVLVDKWAYGYRLPFSRWHGYHRCMPRRVKRGEWMAFNNPDVAPRALVDTSRLCVGLIVSAPGDTVWLGPSGRCSSFRNYQTGCIWPLIVPARGKFIRITPWSAPLYASTIRQHEGVDEVEVVHDSLSVDGHVVDYFRFQHDYYWVFSGEEQNFHDSRSFGFVPESFVLGRLSYVLYSMDARRPWHQRWRRHRLFLPVTNP